MTNGLEIMHKKSQTEERVGCSLASLDAVVQGLKTEVIGNVYIWNTT